MWLGLGFLACRMKGRDQWLAVRVTWVTSPAFRCRALLPEAIQWVQGGTVTRYFPGDLMQIGPQNYGTG